MIKKNDKNYVLWTLRYKISHTFLCNTIFPFLLKKSNNLQKSFVLKFKNFINWWSNVVQKNFSVAYYLFKSLIKVSNFCCDTKFCRIIIYWIFQKSKNYRFAMVLRGLLDSKFFILLVLLKNIQNKITKKQNSLPKSWYVQKIEAFLLVHYIHMVEKNYH